MIEKCNLSSDMLKIVEVEANKLKISQTDYVSGLVLKDSKKNIKKLDARCRVVSHWLIGNPCKEGLVYIVDIGNDNRLYKIGFTNDYTKQYLKGRLRELGNITEQLNNVLIITLKSNCGRGLERALHNLYKDKVSDLNKEWFYLDKNDIGFISKINLFNKDIVTISMAG